ncbi:uncharacterized protein [Prorops nasuta]
MPSYRPWGSTDDGQIEFESLTADTLPGALEVLRKSFFMYESVSTAVGITTEPGAAKELEQLCLDAAKDGISVVAIDVNTTEVVGVAFNVIQLNRPGEKSFFEEFSENCKFKSSKALVEFMMDIDSKIDLFQYYNVDCILEIMFLATLPNYGKRRIGEILVVTSIEIGNLLKRGKNVKTPVMLDDHSFIRNVDAVPGLVSALMTSKYSQKIANRVGFEQLLVVSYDDLIYDGSKYSDRIDKNHKDCALVAKRL